MKKVRLEGDMCRSQVHREREVAMPGFKCLSSNSKSSQVGEGIEAQGLEGRKGNGSKGKEKKVEIRK